MFSNQDAADEIVYTGDLVVGHNQEVTEEEVVTTEEVILSEDGQTEQVVISPDGNFLLAPGSEAVLSSEGHLIINGHEVLLGGRNSDLSMQLLSRAYGSDCENSSPIKFEVPDNLIESQCIINNGKIISPRTSDVSDTFGTGVSVGDSSYNSSEIGDYGKDVSSEINGNDFDDSKVKILIKSEIFDIGTDDVCNGVDIDQGVTLESLKDGEHTHVLQQVLNIIPRK